MKETGVEKGGEIGREKEGKKEEKKEKNLLNLLFSKFCINAFTYMVLVNISVKMYVLLYSHYTHEK